MCSIDLIQYNDNEDRYTGRRKSMTNTDTSNYELLKALKIIKETNIMNDHFGKHQVLYGNFKIENLHMFLSCSPNEKFLYQQWLSCFCKPFNE